MPAVNLFRRARGSAYFRYRGQAFYTKDALAIAPDLKAFGIQNDSTPDVDSRFGGRLVKFTATPIGAWTLAALAVLYPFSSFIKGQFNTPIRKVTAVSAMADTITVPKHRQITGTGVNIITNGAVPTGLTADVTVYVIVVDADTLKLASTEALALAGTAIDLTSAGSGTIKMVQNTPLLINYLDADQTQLTLWNAAITKMPSLSLGATKTAFGAVEFTAYTRHGMSWDDDDSVFTFGTYEDDPPGVDKTEIPTVQYSAQFGDSAPFNDLRPRDGVTIDFTLGLDEVKDSDEVVCHSVNDVSAMAKLLPLNLTEGDLWGELLMQGEGAGLGKSLPSDTLSIFGPDNDPYIQLLGATMQDGALKLGAKEDRIDQISFKTQQTFAEGVTNSIFTLGTEAP